MSGPNRNESSYSEKLNSPDLISRQEALKALRPIMRKSDYFYEILKAIQDMPSAQPEPAIPISWLEKEVEHLESRENSFAVLDAMQLKALIKRWRGEQE